MKVWFKDISNEVITALGVFFTALIAWFFGRKKEKSEIDGTTIENIDKSLNIYQNMINDLDTRYKAIIQGMENEIAELRQKVVILSQQVQQLHEENMSLKNSLKR